MQCERAVGLARAIRCAKVYKEAHQRSFKQAAEYQEGRKIRGSRDARAMSKRTRHGQKESESAWLNAEVEALYKLASAGVRVPKPYLFMLERDVGMAKAHLRGTCCDPKSNNLCYNRGTSGYQRENDVMNVSLTPQLEAFVKQKVETGMYTSVSEVVREALRLMEAQDAVQVVKLTALREDIRRGLSSLENGKGTPLDMSAIKAKGRERLAKKESDAKRHKIS
jgi:putative addiction module CopG family antidote